VTAGFVIIVRAFTQIKKREEMVDGTGLFKHILKP